MTQEPGERAHTTSDDPRIDTVVAGRYRVIQKLGEGGMGAVYRGVHEALRKPVAIKFLLDGARADKEMVARFEREAIAAANLKHPNIAEATDYGQLPDGAFFLVMEYVEGTPLRALLKRGRMEPARASRILAQVGAALALAHARDVVHRDLKPENVIVFDREGERDVVKVIDFGIARVSSATLGGDRAALTKVGSVFGTPEYMAPEQAMGQAVDARADQYALGVLAFELLTGRVPFQANDMGSLLFMHVGAPPPRVTELAPGLPAAVDAVILRMLGKLPEERYGSVAEAMERLSEALAARPATIAITPPPSQAVLAAQSTSADVNAKTIVAMPAPVSVGPRSVAAQTAPVGSLPTFAITPRPASKPGEPPRALLAVIAAGGFTVLIAILVVVLWATRSSKPSSSDASDPAVAAFIDDWSRGRYADSSPALRALLAAHPEIAADAALARALAGALHDKDARREIAGLMTATALGRSPALATALADAAFREGEDERDAALGLLRGRAELLDPERRARVALRDAESCDDLQAAVTALGALATDAAKGDLRALESDCDHLLRQDKLCDRCVGGERGVTVSPGPAGPGFVAPSGKGPGKKKGKKKDD